MSFKIMLVPRRTAKRVVLVVAESEASQCVPYWCYAQKVRPIKARKRLEEIVYPSRIDLIEASRCTASRLGLREEAR